MSGTTAVVLAAGLSRRSGSQKLLFELNGAPLLARVLAACAALPTVVIANPNLRSFLERYPRVRIVWNTAPERGMTHSLRLADAAVAPHRVLAVLLGDKPLASATLLEHLLAERGDADVTFPIRGGVGGHPVIFSPRARSFIAKLPDGDNLHALRDDPHLQRRPVEIADPGAYLDVDTPEALREIARHLSY